MAGILHPFTPFHPTCVYGDVHIQQCQNRIYYMTSRLRAILLNRLNGTKEEVLELWNAHFALELVSRVCVLWPESL